MSLEIRCSSCNRRLFMPGALVFSPPDEDGMCIKYHLCEDCWYPFMRDTGIG